MLLEGSVQTRRAASIQQQGVERGPCQHPAINLPQDDLFLQFFLYLFLTQRLLLKTHLGVCLRSQINNLGLPFKLCAQTPGFIKAFYKSCLCFLFGCNGKHWKSPQAKPEVLRLCELKCFATAWPPAAASPGPQRRSWEVNFTQYKAAAHFCTNRG